MSNYASAAAVRREVAELLRPPRRISVSQAAQEALNIKNASNVWAPWDPTETPEMIEPMNCLASREYDAVVLVAPARTGKTVGFAEGWLTYMLTADPADMLITQISEDKAREFSKKRISGALDNSHQLAAKLSSRAHDNNVHDKIFKSGVYLKIGWPSKNIFASTDWVYVFLTDYDRMPADIGGEGDAFGLAQKRTQAAGSKGMTAMESSPGRPIMDPRFKRPSDQPHLAPPCEGIISYYNDGDRRRLYWPCPECGGWFQPIMEHFDYEAARVFCPHCSVFMEPVQKQELKLAGRWVPEGMWLDGDGELHGERRDVSIASFWMEGPAATYQSWKQLAQRYLSAYSEYQQTGGEERLKTTVNVDQGRPYLPMTQGNGREAEDLQERAEPIEKNVVPEPVRFLTAAVDVQKEHFVVQVEGVGLNEDSEVERWQIDRFRIRKSARLDDEGDPLPVRPAAYLEDWDLLIEKVIDRAYPLEDDPTRYMRVKKVGCDSGGKAGVTEKAYKFYRKLKRMGLTSRFMLLKGASTNTAPRIRKAFPDSERNDRKAGARGEIPVYMINTTILKDAVSHDLDRQAPGMGYYHFPEWLPTWFYQELTAEYRDTKKWHKVTSGARNEAFDLCVYNRAVQIDLKLEKLDWKQPPVWARRQDENALVVAINPKTEQPEEPEQSDQSLSMADLGRMLGGQ